MKKINEAYYSVSLTNPADPSRDPLASMQQWKNPLVSLDQAIRATVGPDDVVYGDPTNFAGDRDVFGFINDYDRGWDIDSNWDLYGNKTAVSR